MEKSGLKLLALGAIVTVAFIAFLIVNPLTVISAGERGVVLNWGAVSNEILEEGIHWVTPIKQKVVKMDVKIQKEEKGATAASKDLQNVTTKVTINYHLDPLKVNTTYQNLRKKYSERVIEPAIQEYIKKTTAKYTAEELVTKREEVKLEIRDTLSKNLEKNNIVLDDIFITDFNFSEKFNAAIEMKVMAEQEALQAKNKLEQVKMEAEQRVAQAKAEAEAIKIQAEAITQQGGKDYVQLQWIEAWRAGGAKVPQFITGSGGANFLYNLNK